MRRLDLAAADGLDAAADHLGDERRRVEHQAHEDGGKGRRQREAAAEVEPACEGHVEGERWLGQHHPRDDGHARDRHRADQSRVPAQPATPARMLDPRALAAGTDRPSNERQDDRQAHDRQPGQERAGKARGRDEQAALVQKDGIGEREAVRDRRQLHEDHEVDDEELEQQRRVADQFDVGADDARQEPVRGEARDAQDDPQHRREDDAHDAEEDGVEHAHQEGMTVRVVGAVGDRTVADLEPGALGEESVAEREVPFGHRRHEVVGQKADADADRQQHDDLRNDPQDTDVTPRRHRGLLAGWEAGHLEGKISPGTDLDPPRGSICWRLRSPHRYGGA